MKSIQNQNQSKKKIAGIIFVIALFVLLCCGITIAFQMVSSRRDKLNYENIQTQAVKQVEAVTDEASQENTAKTEGDTVREPKWYDEYAKAADQEIDFTELSTINEQVAAWISIPGTKIEYPVVHTDIKNDITYLSHDFSLEVSKAGTIYSDGWNSGDFSDNFTLLYGHNMKDGSMFAGLHGFRDSNFFKENQEIILYMPDGQMLTYKIFAAMIVGDNHILAETDFQNDTVYQKYIDGLKNTRDMSAQFREVELTTEDRILTLCTCIGEDNKRFFVQGVLLKDGQDR